MSPRRLSAVGVHHRSLVAGSVITDSVDSGVAYEVGPSITLLRSAFAASPTGMGVVAPRPDGNHLVIFANRALGALFGAPDDAVAGRVIEDLLVDRRDGVRAESQWREVRCRDAAGAEVWTRWWVSTLPTSADAELLVQIDVIDERVKARQQAHRTARLLDLIPEPVIIRGLDGTIVYWNHGATETYGHAAEDVIGRRTHDVLATRFDGITLPELETQLAVDRSWRGQLQHRHADGRTLRMASKHVRDDDADGASVILEVNIDITDRVAAERALAASESKFRSQFLHSSVGQLIRRLDGVIEEVNPALAGMLGYRAEELIGMHADRLFDPGAAALRQTSVASLLSGEAEQVMGEGVLIRADGSPIDVEVHVSVARGPEGDAEHIIGVYQDITDRKVAESVLAHRAFHDPLTGLANRARLLEQITLALSEARRTARSVGVIYLDLDHFKNVNDTLGHHVGDDLLCQIGERLRECVRAEDTVARLGGDEFVILCPQLDSRAQLHSIAARILHEVAQPYDLVGHRVTTVTASIGLNFPTLGSDPATVLTHADQAMYTAKREGKNRVSA